LEQIRMKFGNVQKGMLEMANGMAKNAREESKLLQEMSAVDKRNEKKKKKAKGMTRTGEKAKKKKSGNKKGATIVEIYGHELYEGVGFEECGAEWFHVKYSNGKKESVTAVVVSEEAPGLGADYILEFCMDVERDRKSFGEWLERMQHASNNIAEV
jgi:hypothetical protein